MRALAPDIRRARGRWQLLGVDVVVNERLVPTLLEANSNPELTVDPVRAGLNSRLIRRTIDLVLETHAKARTRFGRTRPGGCPGGPFDGAVAGSADAASLLRTAVPGWSLLYSEAVTPPFSAAPTHSGTECYVGAK